MKITNSSVDYHKSLQSLSRKMVEESVQLRNPMLIHRIQDKLNNLKGNDFATISIRQAAKSDLNEAIKAIWSQWKDNPALLESVVGKETISLIKEYLNV